MDTDYDKQFYDTITEGSERSAMVVVPIWTGWILLEEPESIVDIGCGRGVWGKVFAEYCDAEVLGIDGPYVTDPIIPFMAHDLREPLILDKRYDLAICLEVAEHLPEESADVLVKSLVDASDNIIFSAAIPFQSGHGHINCQWPSYWAKKFARHGYVVYDYRAEFWNDERIEPWYRQNMLYFTKEPSVVQNIDLERLDMVHPVIHGWGR